MLKTAICYFSGSGNSFEAALEICRHIDIKATYYIPNLDIKKLDEFEEIIIVSPLYKFNIPKTVQDFIRKLKPDIRYYVVLNGCGIPANYKSKVKKLFKYCHLELAGIYTVAMPASFSVYFRQPEFIIHTFLGVAERRLKRIAKRIYKNEGKTVNLKRVGYVNRFAGYSKFAHYLSVDSGCAKCGKCMELCPTDNIRMFQNGIDFGEKCISCMGCYNRCEHILYKGRKTKTYTNPNVDFNAMR